MPEEKVTKDLINQLKNEILNPLITELQKIYARQQKNTIRLYTYESDYLDTYKEFVDEKPKSKKLDTYLNKQKQIITSLIESLTMYLRERYIDQTTLLLQLLQQHILIAKTNFKSHRVHLSSTLFCGLFEVRSDPYIAIIKAELAVNNMQKNNVIQQNTPASKIR